MIQSIKAMWTLKLYDIGIFFLLWKYSNKCLYDFTYCDNEDGRFIDNYFDGKSLIYIWGKDKSILRNTILHELGHYISTVEKGNKFSTIKEEIEAWKQAKKLSHTYNITFNETDMFQCLRSYKIRAKRIKKIFK